MQEKTAFIYTVTAKLWLFHNFKVGFRWNVPSLAHFARSALPGALPFSFSSWNTANDTPTPLFHVGVLPINGG